LPLQLKPDLGTGASGPFRRQLIRATACRHSWPMDANVHAPEIDRPGLSWFNLDRPLSLASLRGKLVILDFWTSSCINCMHVIPSLRRVEETFPEEVAVIGVHSPKFPAEQEPQNVAAAIARYNIAHPVVHDPQFALWREYAVRAWPTLVFIGPDGRVIGQNSGEPDPDLLVDAVRELIERYRGEGSLAPQALTLAPVGEKGDRFSFPGKLKPLTAKHGKLWALADSGHHQIVVLDDGGRELSRYGSGTAGFADGARESARFNAPQGLVCGSDREGNLVIYVADTGNHAIRRIDRASGEVTTLAGTGRRGTALEMAKPARETDLASVWDLERKGEEIFFANAGTHQVGALDLSFGTVRALAGNGSEAIVDGAAAEAELAQPSGLAFNGAQDRLFFADSETSAIRMVAFAGVMTRVTTLVGSGLFDFGHKNGFFESARLQHPLGLTWLPTGGPGTLIVADSYNDALRLLDLEHRQVRDFAADFECTDPVCLPLAEPAGVWADDTSRLLVVDTNNHRVLEYRLTQRSYSTWSA
jgi:thiol-disulfide isomerase/thioredoxin